LVSQEFAEHTSRRRRVARAQNENQPREVVEKADDLRNLLLMRNMVERMERMEAELAAKNAELAAKNAEIAAILRDKDAQIAAAAAAVVRPPTQPAVSATTPPDPPPPRSEVCKDIVNFSEDDINRLVDEISQKVVPIYNEHHTLGDKCNFDIQEIIKSVMTVSTASDNILLSNPQTNKSIGIAILAICAKMFGIPFMCFVHTQKRNVSDMCVNKMRKVLETFGITTFFLNNTKKQLAKMSDKEIEMFKRGELAIFAQGRFNNLREVTAFIKRRKVYNIALTLDESDAFFSSAPHKPKTSKEKALIDMVCDELRAKELNSYVRCIHYVSATQMSTRDVVAYSRRPFRRIVADVNKLKERGYALADSVKVLCDPDGKPQYLDPDMQNKKNSFNLNAKQIDVMMKLFAKQLNDKTVRRKGGLLMAVLAPFVSENDKGVTICADVAKCLMDKYRAFTLEIMAEEDGMAIPDGDKVAIIGLVVRGGGIDRYTLKWNGSVSKDTIIGDVGDIIRSIDEEYSLDVPVIVSGYFCLFRNTSVRSWLRVITHIIASMTKGINHADVYQTDARYGGESVKIRKDNGFDCVTALLQEGDATFGHPNMHDINANYLVNDDEMDEVTIENVAKLAKIRSLAPREMGKYMGFNADLRLGRARGTIDIGKQTQSYEEMEDERENKNEENKKLKHDMIMSCAKDRDAALALADDAVVDPGAGVAVSLPLAVRISRKLKASGDVQVPGVIDFETDTKFKTVASAAAFLEFGPEFVNKKTFTKPNEAPKDEYKIKESCCRIVMDAYRNRENKDMKQTVYVLTKVDPDAGIATSSSFVPRTLQWKFVEDKETKRVTALYTVAGSNAAAACRVRNVGTDLATVVKDCESASQFVPSTVRSERVKLLYRFFALNPGFVGSVRHITHALPIFNKDIVDEINDQRGDVMDLPGLIYGSDFANYVANNILEAVTKSVYKVRPTYKWKINV
jgi:hypothetical protein